ncbi:hypothetical protein FC682_18290 [Peribacillus simplex]|uniref:Uncharacterized protein n=1 Tax=Peribacillus simplex TaxID=1478 RepID=A0A9X8ZCZ4_9BACI|nr:hypothetical protein [Peribacillus simplex]TKH03350.1 hypothetical protein FC682_18290 [Peribacillus simplex]TKH06088.1 hypothetical protein FC678_23750 [Peribacillus simplex]
MFKLLKLNLLVDTVDHFFCMLTHIEIQVFKSLFMFSDERPITTDEVMPITFIEREDTQPQIKLTKTGDVGWVPSEAVSKISGE